MIWRPFVTTFRCVFPEPSARNTIGGQPAGEQRIVVCRMTESGPSASADSTSASSSGFHSRVRATLSRLDRENTPSCSPFRLRTMCTVPSGEAARAATGQDDIPGAFIAPAASEGSVLLRDRSIGTRLKTMKSTAAAAQAPATTHIRFVLRRETGMVVVCFGMGNGDFCRSAAIRSSRNDSGGSTSGVLSRARTTCSMASNSVRQSFAPSRIRSSSARCAGVAC